MNVPSFLELVLPTHFALFKNHGVRWRRITAATCQPTVTTHIGLSANYNDTKDVDIEIIIMEICVAC